LDLFDRELLCRMYQRQHTHTHTHTLSLSLSLSLSLAINQYPLDCSQVEDERKLIGVFVRMWNEQTLHTNNTVPLSKCYLGPEAATITTDALKALQTDRWRRLAMLPNSIDLTHLTRVCLVLAIREHVTNHWSKLAFAVDQQFLATHNNDYQDKWWTGFTDDGKSGLFLRDHVVILLDDPLSIQANQGVTPEGYVDDTWVVDFDAPHADITPISPRASTTAGTTTTEEAKETTATTRYSSDDEPHELYNRAYYTAPDSTEPYVAPISSATAAEVAAAAAEVACAITSPVHTFEASTRVVLSGYLLKKGGTALWSAWQRRWFVLDRIDKRIYYYTDKEYAATGAYRGFIDVLDITTVHPSFYHGTLKEKGIPLLYCVVLYCVVLC
jgi:hypothetical protein